MELAEWVLAELPPPPASVLEVGCGQGELARVLEAAGHDVLAIDPVAPEGPIFRRLRLEELDAGAFDAVVASRSLHHVHDLDAAVGRLAELAPLLVLDEFGWDLLDADTADWYERQRRVLIAAGREPSGPPAAEWEAHHADLHGYHALRAALERRFVERESGRLPYLYRYLGGEATESLERTLLAAGAISGLGWRAVYERQRPA
jgi:SAM-dependent methyltransferase